MTMARTKGDAEKPGDEGSAEGGAPQSGSFASVKAELVQLEQEVNAAIRINEIGERSEVDQILTTMQRRLRDVNKTV
jgi:uncharacterized protein YlaN (UPF0358 family)